MDAVLAVLTHPFPLFLLLAVVVVTVMAYAAERER